MEAFRLESPEPVGVSGTFPGTFTDSGLEFKPGPPLGAHPHAKPPLGFLYVLRLSATFTRARAPFVYDFKLRRNVLP